MYLFIYLWFSFSVLHYFALTVLPHPSLYTFFRLCYLFIHERINMMCNFRQDSLSQNNLDVDHKTSIYGCHLPPSVCYDILMVYVIHFNSHNNK